MGLDSNTLFLKSGLGDIDGVALHATSVNVVIWTPNRAPTGDTSRHARQFVKSPSGNLTVDSASPMPLSRLPLLSPSST